MGQMIDTYRYNRGARAYNRAISESKNPLIVGGAKGAVVGAVLTSSFHASSAHERALRTIGGTIGGAAGGVKAAQVQQRYNRRVRQLNETHQGKPAPIRSYFRGR